MGSFGDPRPDGVDVRLGDTAPLHCSSVGKTLLAYQPRGLMTQIARTSGFPRFTSKTFTNLASLRKDLDQIRGQGYALDLEEAVEGIIGVGGPVFDHTGGVIAAFSVAGPATRLSVQRMPEIARLVSRPATGFQIAWGTGARWASGAGRQVGRQQVGSGQIGR